ncbi:DUF418 domain-containing protein [Nonomuraea sp. NPDC002799]
MNTSIQASSQAPGLTERALAPDLARGVMLLAIGFAHAPLFVTLVDRGPDLANRATALFHLLFVNNHARPLFAFLFGYALVQLMNQRLRRGSDPVSVRKLLRRRGWWLVAIGFAHTALLVPTDILAGYGLAAVLLIGLLRVKDATLLWAAGLSLVPATVAVAFAMWFPLSQGVSTYTLGSIAAGTRGVAEMFVERLTTWPLTMTATILAVMPGVILGIWAARRRLLEEPGRHRGFLIRATAITTALSLLGSIPVWLVEAGVWSGLADGALLAVAVAQPLTGYFGGIGLAGLVALVALRIGDRRGPVTTAVAPGTGDRRGPVTTAFQALGQRSMSFYLFQSVVFVVVFHPYGLGLQDDLGLAGATVVAVVTWSASLAAAEVMRRAGHRGPAELLLRRLAYGRERQAGSAPQAE